MAERIRGLLVKPGMQPEEYELENTLEELQRVVDGYIECVNLSKDVVLICNEEGKIRGLEPNRFVGNDCIMGNFLIVGDDGHGEFTSLSDESIKKYNEKFMIESASMDTEVQITGRFIENLNSAFNEIKLDLKELWESCNSGDKGYAKQILKKMHESFVKAAGTDNVDVLREKGVEYLTLPAVIQAQDRSKMCLGLVYLDISSSGEHYGTDFITEYGIGSYEPKGAESNMKDVITSFLPYRYYYTPTYNGDIHINGNIPKEVSEMLDFANQGIELKNNTAFQDIMKDIQ